MNDAGRLIVRHADIFQESLNRLYNAARNDDLETAEIQIETLSLQIEAAVQEFIAFEEFEADWIDVESSAFDRIAYVPEEEILALQFKGDTRPHKYRVPKDVWKQFLGVRSKGRFFQNSIRNVYAQI